MRGDRQSADGPFQALVMNMDTRAGILFARGLGGNGLRVAGATWQTPAPGMLSRHVKARVRLASLDDSAACARSLLAWLSGHPSEVVITSSDGGVMLLSEHRVELERHAAPAIGSPEAVSIALSKPATQDAAGRVGVPTPRSLVARSPADVEAAASEIGWPALLKPFSQFRRRPDGAAESVKPRFLRNAKDARRAGDIVRADAPALVQEVLTGQREMHQVFRDRGRVLLHVALRAERFWPEYGVAALRTTIRVPEDSGEYARRLVDEIGLDGPCVVEFRRDTTGRARALEVNARPAQGSSESIVRAGIDLPHMVFEWARGGRVEPVTRYPVGVRVGWLAADAARVAAGCSLIHANPRPPLAQSTRELLTDYLPGRARPEGLDLSDPLPLLVAVPALARMTLNRTGAQRARAPSTNPS